MTAMLSMSHLLVLVTNAVLQPALKVSYAVSVGFSHDNSLGHLAVIASDM